MGDVRDWTRFIRGRWDWTKFGYERGFPRGCQFTDVDAAVEFDGRRLVLEAKQYDGIGELPAGPPYGQLLFLRDEAELGKTVLVVYGCGVCDDPYAIYDVGRREWFKFQNPDTGLWLNKDQRRTFLKLHIDRAMGLRDEEFRPLKQGAA